MIKYTEIINLFSRVATQAGRWQEIYIFATTQTNPSNVPADNYIIIASDLNGLGHKKADSSRYHEEGFETDNEGTQRVVNFTDAPDSVIVNTWYMVLFFYIL